MKRAISSHLSSEKLSSPIYVLIRFRGVGVFIFCFFLQDWGRFVSREFLPYVCLVPWTPFLELTLLGFREPACSREDPSCGGHVCLRKPGKRTMGIGYNGKRGRGGGAGAHTIGP